MPRGKRLQTFVLKLWGIIGVLVLLCAGIWGISWNHHRRVANLKIIYDEAIETTIKYETWLSEWKEILRLGGKLSKVQNDMYKLLTEKSYHSDGQIMRDNALVEAKKSQTEAFEAWYKAKDQWW